MWGSCNSRENLQMDSGENVWVSVVIGGENLACSFLCLPRSSCLTGEQVGQPPVLFKQPYMDPWEPQLQAPGLAALPWEGKGQWGRARAPCRSWGYQGVPGERHWDTWQEPGILIWSQAALVLLPVELLLCFGFTTCCCIQHCLLSVNTWKLICIYKYNLSSDRG